MLVKNSLLISAATITVAAGAFLGLTEGSSGALSNVVPTPTIAKQLPLDKRRDFPVTDYSNQPSRPEDTKRDEKYDMSLGALTPELSKDVETVSTAHWASNLTALPVDESDIIVLGKVLGTSAHLSSRKDTVYTQIVIEIEREFRRDRPHKLVSTRLVAEREGGIVRYRSGFKAWYHVIGQNMPVVGNRYVLFLSRKFPFLDVPGDDLYLLTGYELKDGIVFPLDSPGESHPLTTEYRGLAESHLLSDLTNRLR